MVLPESEPGAPAGVPGRRGTEPAEHPGEPHRPVHWYDHPLTRGTGRAPSGGMRGHGHPGPRTPEAFRPELTHSTAFSSLAERSFDRAVAERLAQANGDFAHNLVTRGLHRVVCDLAPHYLRLEIVRTEAIRQEFWRRFEVTEPSGTDYSAFLESERKLQIHVAELTNLSVALNPLEQGPSEVLLLSTAGAHNAQVGPPVVGGEWQDLRNDPVVRRVLAAITASRVDRDAGEVRAVRQPVTGESADQTRSWTRAVADHLALSRSRAALLALFCRQTPREVPPSGAPLPPHLETELTEILIRVDESIRMGPGDAAAGVGSALRWVS